MKNITYSENDIELIEKYYYLCAAEDFYTFRRLLSPKDKINWFYRELIAHLQQFFVDFQAGKKPKLIIQTPPQHGKSAAVVEFCAWLAGQAPSTKMIYASFSERLGVRANLKLQRTFSSEVYKKIFPKTKINLKNVTNASGQFLRNKEILEFVDEIGYFRNTTVQGAVTGESLDLAIIDDPLKGREEANSKTIREKTWDWFTDDFFTRFSEHAGLLMILTRWHIDDPAARMIEVFKDTIKVLKYPAIAEEDEASRLAGAPLFPELKSKEFLLERKNAMTASNWQALYQQNPTVPSGEMIKTGWFRWYEALPALTKCAIFVDTAQKTGERNDFTVAQLWGCDNTHIFLLDQLRVKEEAPTTLKMLESFYFKHVRTFGVFKMFIEDASSGSSILQFFKQKNILCEAIIRKKDKIERANLFSGFIELGKVYLNSRVFDVNIILDEATAFPNAKHDDTIDPMLDAIEHFLFKNSLNAWKMII